MLFLTGLSLLRSCLVIVVTRKPSEPLETHIMGKGIVANFLNHTQPNHT